MIAIGSYHLSKVWGLGLTLSLRVVTATLRSLEPIFYKKKKYFRIFEHLLIHFYRSSKCQTKKIPQNSPPEEVNFYVRGNKLMEVRKVFEGCLVLLV